MAMEGGGGVTVTLKLLILSGFILEIWNLETQISGVRFKLGVCSEKTLL